MLDFFVQHPTQKIAAATIGLTVGATTWLDIAPKLAGLVVSIMSIVWMGIQMYYYFKDRNKK